MKLELTILILTAALVVAGPAAIAVEDDRGDSEVSITAEKVQGTQEELSSMGKPVNIGNKICPVSDEEIGLMGEGVQVEYEGKIYNLCCPMCVQTFNAEPQKYIEKINEELEASKDQIKD
jgi:YHS domain-containing protein